VPTLQAMRPTGSVAGAVRTALALSFGALAVCGCPAQEEPVYEGKEAPPLTPDGPLPAAPDGTPAIEPSD
jgi:hypothetical protein